MVLWRLEALLLGPPPNSHSAQTWPTYEQNNDLPDHSIQRVLPGVASYQSKVCPCRCSCYCIIACWRPSEFSYSTVSLEVTFSREGWRRAVCGDWSWFHCLHRTIRLYESVIKMSHACRRLSSSTIQLLCTVHSAQPDATKLSTFVQYGGVNWVGDNRRQSAKIPKAE